MEQHNKKSPKRTLSAIVHSVLFVIAAAYVVLGVYSASWGLAVVGFVLIPFICLSAYMSRRDKKLVITISMEDSR